MHILSWVGEQYAIRFDHLQKLAGNLSHHPQAVTANGLNYNATYRIVTRWVKAGLVERTKIFAKDPLWVWLTTAGLNAVGLDNTYRHPAISRLAHIHAVNAVRLRVEERVGDKARWICEREANAFRKVQRKKHKVDGELEYRDGVTVAIEVELTQKRRTRLNAVLRELKHDYDTVWYFATNDCYQAIKNAIGKVPDHEETFILRPLSSIMNR